MKTLRLAGLMLCIMLITSSGAMPQSPPQMPPAPVAVAEVSVETIQRPISLVGVVEPNKTSTIASEISGVIGKFPGKEGAFVKAGEVIAEFRTEQLNIKLREARAARREAEARFSMAKKSFARFRQLKDKGVVSTQQLDDSESETEAWGARVAELDARIESLGYDLSRARITAPFSGFITREFTEIGEWVSEGGAVVELIEADIVKIKVDAPERYISLINSGETVSISLDALPRRTIEGKVVSVVPQASNQARTFPVKVAVENKERALKSGMVARVSFLIGDAVKVKLVPKDAVSEFNNASLVFVVANGVANPVPVSRGISYKSLVEVSGPIEAGQLIVIRGNERLQPGQPVQVVNQGGRK
ncbi:MAG: efflux RND transporter periplasmic adaptor subunit [Deltaproteobacteria bacterium]